MNSYSNITRPHVRVWRPREEQTTEHCSRYSASLSPQQFIERIEHCYYSYRRHFTDDYGRVECDIYISPHAAQKMRERGFINSPELLSAMVERVVNMPVIGERISRLGDEPVKMVVLENGRYLTFTCHYDVCEEIHQILAQSVFYDTWNMKNTFYVPNKEMLCFKLIDGRIIEGVENIPEMTYV